MFKRALVLSAGLLSLILLPHDAEAFWYARGWRGGVAVGGFRPPAVVTPYYLHGCLRCAPTTTPQFPRHWQPAPQPWPVALQRERPPEQRRRRPLPTPRPLCRKRPLLRHPPPARRAVTILPRRAAIPPPPHQPTRPPPLRHRARTRLRPAPQACRGTRKRSTTRLRRMSRTSRPSRMPS
jgi:hypothetical protein